MQQLPPQWPAAVDHPEAPGFERTALAWLWELMPTEYRSYDVLRRHPALLARFAEHHVSAALEAARAGWRTARSELGSRLPVEVVEQVVAVYEREGLRLRRLVGQVRVVGEALWGGSRHVEPDGGSRRSP